MDLVSIITPLYNSQKFIESTILSVIAQTYNSWEMIIVDDASVDKGLSIAEKYSKIDSRIRIYKLPSNQGSANARNRAIGLAGGRFIAFLDSDDLWHPEKLKKQIAFMITFKYSFTYTSYNKINESGLYIGSVNIKNNIIKYSDLLYTNSIGCLTVVLDLKLLGGKKYMPLIIKRNDYALWLCILNEGNLAHGLPEALGEYRYRKSSLSSNKFQVIRYQWIVYRREQGFGVIKSMFYMLFYAYYGLKK